MKSKFLLTMILSLFFVTGVGRISAQELPNAEVLSLGVTSIEAGDYVSWPSGGNTTDLNVPVMMEFIALDTPDEAAQNYYADSITDFYITFSGLENDIITADENCYLIGNYGTFGWIKIPVSGMELEDDITYPILTSGAFGDPIEFTYEAICTSVKDFKCGIGISEAILEANPNMTVTLELGLSREVGAKFVRVGEAYTYDVTDLRGIVAMMNGVEYETLYDAVEAAAENGGGEIVMQNNFSFTNTITVPANNAKSGNGEIVLDLNGKTISMQDASGAGAYAIKNNGNLTIKDSAEGGKITFNSTTPDNNAVPGYSTSTIGNGGHLTIENGIIENTTVGGASYAIDGIWHTGEVSLTINDGTITAKKIAVRQVPFSATAKNTVTINGGTLTGEMAGLQMFNTSNNAMLSETVINGGVFNGTYGFYTSFTSAQGSNLATINIDGGVFNGYVFLYNGKNGSNAYPMTVAITDGIFNAGAYVYTKDNNGNEVPIKSISGGTFAYDQSEYCAPGYICEYDEETGTYGVIIDPEIGGEAMVEGEGYPTLEAAIEAATSGQTVTLLTDVVIESRFELEKSLTFDLNNKSITSTGENVDIFKVLGKNITVKNGTLNANRIAIFSDGNTETANKVNVNNVSINSNYWGIYHNGNKFGADVEIVNSEIKDLSGAGIFLSGSESWNNAKSAKLNNLTINNSTIEGPTAVEVKYGNITINDSELISTSEEQTVVDNGNGSCTEGYALALTNNPSASTVGSINLYGENTLTGGIIVKAEGEVNVTTNSADLIPAPEGYYWNEGVLTPIANTDAEAVIGTTYYTTLEAAVEAATSGQTVTLLKDVVKTDLIKIENTITLDLNGKTVTANCKKAFEVYANATIKNGTIWSQQRCVDTRKAVELTLENLSLEAPTYYAAYGNQQPLTIGGSENGTVVNMTNVNIIAGNDDNCQGYGIITFVKSTVNASNCDILGYMAIYVKGGSDGSEFNVTNSNIRTDMSGNDVSGNTTSALKIEENVKNVEINITNSSIVRTIGTYMHAIEVLDTPNTISISNCTMECETDFLHEACIFEGNTILLPAEYADELRADGYIISEAVNGQVQVTGKEDVKYVARVGTEYYETLEEAFNAAETGDEVVVLNDIILPAKSENGAFEIAETVGNVTLNLNGFDITSSERIGYTGRTNYAFDNYANLTIKGEGTITARGIQNYGTLTIEGNDVTIISNDELVGNGACIWGYQGSATIIKGGTFRGLAKGAGAINTEGSLEITGGTFSADGKQDEGYHVYTIQCKGDNTVNTISGATLSSGRHGVIVVQNGAELTINNVEATREGVPGQSGHVLYVADNGMLTINGGTFVNEDASAGSSVIYTNANSTTYVTDGTFTNQGTANVISGAGTTTLTGGNYSKDVTNHCAAGYISQQNESGRWDVVINPEITGEAMVNGIGYETLEAAIAVANAEDDEDEVVLLKDVTIESKIDVTKSLVLNGNNKTLTYTGSDRAIDVRKETNGANLTVRNLTIEFTQSYCERGINYNTSGTLTLENVNVNGGSKVTYAVNLPGSSDNAIVNITNSSLTGRIALNIWGQYTEIKADNTYFTSVDPTPAENYAAIAINNDGIISADNSSFLTINGGSIIARDENGDPSTAIRVSTIATISIDESTIIVGEITYPEAVVYYNGTDNVYACLTFKDAIDKAIESNAAGVRLLRSATGPGIFIEANLNLDLTIDFCGNKYSFTEPAVGSPGTVSQGFHIEKGNKITLKNGTLNVAEAAGEAFAMLIQNYADLTITDMTLDGDHLDRNNYSYVLSVNCGDVLINGSTSILANEVEGENHFAFDSYDYSAGGYTELPVVTVNTTGTIRGVVEVSAVLNLEAVGTNSISNIVISGEGQLYHEVEGIHGTIVKTFENDGDDDPENDWYTLATPFSHSVSNLQTSSAYALYRYNEADALWENVKDETNEDFSTLDLGRGYIYANAETTTVEFKGELNVNTVTYQLTASSETNLKGFHLVGNPFTHEITMSHLTGATLASGFYVLENDGAWVSKTNSDKIAAGQAALIKTTEAKELTIVKNGGSKSREVNNGQLMINVANSRYNDVAYVSFNKGIGLNKIAHRNAEIPMVYVPVNGENYAVATMSNEVTEIPVSFEAKTMGEYTLSVEAQDCEFAQMYLIDKMTGYSTNLLLEDYTFMAKSGDNAERFVIRLVNSFDHSFGAENFIIFNDEEMMINDIQGEGVIRIVDVLGRPVAEYNVFGSANISTTSFRSGAYMIQVIDESGVKVQKIIID